MDTRYLDRRRLDDGPHLDTEEIRRQVGAAVAQALSEANSPGAGTVVIQNLTVNVKVASINSAQGGGATVNVNVIERGGDSGYGEAHIASRLPRIQKLLPRQQD